MELATKRGGLITDLPAYVTKYLVSRTDMAACTVDADGSTGYALPPGLGGVHTV